MRQTAAFPNKCLSYTFSTGSETGADYKTFERAYKRYLTALCKENNWQLTSSDVFCSFDWQVKSILTHLRISSHRLTSF